MTYAKNERTKAALGIVRTEFKFYRANKAWWSIVMKDGTQFTVVTNHLGSESTVLRLAAEHLAKMGRSVQYPESA